MLDNIYDNYGTNYKLKDIVVEPKISIIDGDILESTLLCTSGIFEIYFEKGSGMELTNNPNHIARRNVICSVFSDVSNFLVTPLKNNNTKIKIWIRDFDELQNTSYGVSYGSSYYNIPVNTKGTASITDNELWKTVSSGVNSYNNTTQYGNTISFYHGILAFKFNGEKWNTSLNRNAVATEKDLYTYALREVVHALGFTSLLDEKGSSKLGDINAHYSRFDTFLKNANGQNLITSSGDCSPLHDILFTGNSSNLSSSCTTNTSQNNQAICSNTIRFVGTSTLPLFTPNCFNKISSLNFINKSCTSFSNNYFLMANTIGNGITKRNLSPEEKNVLNDIGYTTNNNYGSTSNLNFISYPNNIQEVKVVGVNDGLDAYNYTIIGETSMPTNINGFLTNDVGATSTNIRFECLKDVFYENDDTTTISTRNGDSNTAVILTSTIGGLHLLSYVPYDNLSGKRGNITYIYVYLKAFCGNIQPNPCNFITNGDFEQNLGTPTLMSQFGQLVCNWFDIGGAGTPDYLSGPSTICGIPNNQGSYSPNPTNLLTPGSGLAYAAIAINRIDYGSGEPVGFGNEVILTKLNTVLASNTPYTLSFQVLKTATASSNFYAEIQAYLVTKATGFPIYNVNFLTGNYIPPAGSILLDNNNQIADSTQWLPVSFNFTTGAIAGQNYLYIGGLVNPSFADSDLEGKLCYYYIDNVILKPAGATFNPQLNLPTPLCANAPSFNLATYLTNGVTGGVFSGAGVTFAGGIYTFSPATAGAGTHTITYTIPSPIACPPVVITSTITVTNCLPAQKPYISQVYAGATNDKAVEIKNKDNTTAIAPGMYYLVYYDGAGLPVDLTTPTDYVDIAATSNIAANGIKLIKASGFTTPAYANAVPSETLTNFGNYSGGDAIIILSTSNGANAYDDRIDILGDPSNPRLVPNVLEKAYSQETYTSVVRASCTPMGFPRVEYDEQDWVGFDKAYDPSDDNEVLTAGNKINGELGRHWSDILAWKFTNTWNDSSPDESNPDRSRTIVLNSDYCTGINPLSTPIPCNVGYGSFEACSLNIQALQTLTITPSTYVGVQTKVDIDPNFAQLIVQDQGALVMVRDCYYTPTEGLGCGTDLVNLGANSTMNATKTTVALSGDYDYVYWSSPLSTNIANPKLNQIFNFGSGTGPVFNPNRFYLFQNNKFCDIYKRFLGIVGNTDGYDDNYDDYDPSDTPAEQSAYTIPGRGYATWPPAPATAGNYNYNITFTGEMNNGLIEVPVYKNNSASGRNSNLVGNPFPSAIDLAKFFTTNASIIEPIAYIWTRVTTPDDPNSTYQGPNGLNYTAANFSVYTTNMSLNTENNPVFLGGSSILSSGQSFFVRTYKMDTSGFSNPIIPAQVIAQNAPVTTHPLEEIITAGNVQFRNFMRTTTPNITFSKMATARSAVNTGNKIWVNLTDTNNYTAQLGICFKPTGTAGYSPREDAATIAGRKYNFYTQSTTEDLLIDVQDDFDTAKIIPLGITNLTGQNQTFTISIPKKEGVFVTQNVYLFDNITNRYYNLSNSNYTFQTTDAVIENRFSLCFAQNNPNLAKQILENEDIKVFVANDTLKVVSVQHKIKSVEVYDIYSSNNSGLVVNKRNDVNDNETSLPLRPEVQFINVRIILENGTIINKKIKK